MWGFLKRLFGVSSDIMDTASRPVQTSQEKYWPRISKATTLKEYRLGEYRGVLLSEIESLQRVHFQYIFGVYNSAGEMCYCVASEKEDAAFILANNLGTPSFFLGIFPGDGHLNLGTSLDWGDADKFVSKALEIIEKQFGVKAIPV